MIYHIYIYIFVYICKRGRWFEKWGRTGTPRQGDLFVLIHFFRWTLKCFISGLRKTPFLRQTSAGNWKTKVRRKQKKTHPWPPSKGVSKKHQFCRSGFWWLKVGWGERKNKSDLTGGFRSPMTGSCSDHDLRGRLHKLLAELMPSQRD